MWHPVVLVRSAGWNIQDWKEFKHMVRRTLGVAHETVCDADLHILFEQAEREHCSAD